MSKNKLNFVVLNDCWKNLFPKRFIDFQRFPKQYKNKEHSPVNL